MGAIRKLLPTRFRLSREAKAQVQEIVEQASVGHVDAERQLLALQSAANVTDGEARTRYFLHDQEDQLASLAVVRRLERVDVKGQKRDNVIHHRLRRWEELTRKYPALAQHTDDEIRRLFADLERYEEVT